MPPQLKQRYTCKVKAGNVTLMVVEKAPNCNLSTNHTITHLRGAGVYKVSLVVYNTWRGTRRRTLQLRSKSGVFVLGDACYLLEGEPAWSQFCIEAGKSKDRPYTTVDTGGAGSFFVDVTIEFVQ